MNKPAALFLLAALLLLGCKNGSLDCWSCETPTAPPFPTTETCRGPCGPLLPLGWSRPVLLWSGPQFEAPECPADRAGIVQYEGHADPNVPPECFSCSCEPSTGECELPSFLTAGSQKCGFQDPPPIIYDFSGLDPEPMSCNTTNAIPADLIKSLTISPLIMTESGCKPVTTLPPKSGDVSWKTFARACGSVVSPCQDQGALCVSTAEPPPGYSQCIYQQGEHECPSGYPDRRVFYDDISDSRHCSECSCGAPEGSECSSYVRAYEDATCSILVSVDLVSSTQLWAECGDMVTSPALGGKTATAPIYEPGTCEPSGGEPSGSVELKGPTTFCCQ